MWLLLLCLVVGLFFYYLPKYNAWVARFPPGPPVKPFIGNMLNYKAAHMADSNAKWGKDFDGLFTVFVPLPIIMIHDYETVREAYVDNGNAFSGRIYRRALEALIYEKDTGVLNSNGDVWREERRKALTIMRDLGMGKNVMEEIVRDSLREFVDHVDSLPNHENVDLRWPIQIMVSNVINEVLFARKFAYDNCEELMNFVTLMKKNFDEISFSPLFMLAVAFPFIIDLPWLGYRAVGRHKENTMKMMKFVVNTVDSVLAEQPLETEADEHRCFVHAYAHKMGDQIEKKQLYATCADFFMAGQETTTTVLRWAVLFLAKFQDSQKRLRDEVHSVVGTERLPSMTDKNQLPYAHSYMLEVLRFANILQANIMRVTTEDTVIKGHRISAGSAVNGDIHYIMSKDPHFEQPEKFMPERFLAEGGQSLKKVGHCRLPR
ncbi:hypothetical protein WR25_15256 isoform B [Diploscapter pachys]|uniref:Cytochrome P450 n=1 Tax=Diploscapter pachys TaxID=2018661 RepID=A0A2A2LVC6_9BILA|nr:hypothetical protein WR25_15256 isoform B [Diploscapter pachys]